MKTLSELLLELSKAHGPSGWEDEIREIIISQIKNDVKEIKIDKLGNLYVNIKGKKSKNKILVSAHMDEVGFIIKHIEPEGFLRFEILGSIDPRVILGQRILLKGNKAIIGIVGTTPPHVLSKEEAKSPANLNELYIDIGATSKQDCDKLGINIGTTGTFQEQGIKITDNSIAISKALDNRSGCAAALKVIESMIKNKPESDVTFVFTVQEEVGLRGASVITNEINPDVAIILENTVAADTPGVLPKDHITKIGKGPGIRVMDATMITQRKIFEHIKRTAEINKIPHQIQLMPKGGTDAGRIHLTNKGLPTGVIATPCRYLHSPSLLLNIQDLKNVIKLTELTIRSIKNKEQFTFNENNQNE